MTRYDGYTGVEVEVHDDGIVVCTLNRPESLNAFDGQMRQDIHRLLYEVSSDDEARVFVMTGAGRAFCSGADLTAKDRRGWPIRSHEPMFGWCTDLLEMPKPTICALNGLAAGGGLGLSLLFDIRICSSTAKLLPICMKRAIHPDDLITWTLPRLVGYSRALARLAIVQPEAVIPSIAQSLSFSHLRHVSVDDIERKQRSVAMQPDAKLVQIEMLLSRAEALAVPEVAREITSRRNAA